MLKHIANPPIDPLQGGENVAINYLGQFPPSGGEVRLINYLRQYPPFKVEAWR